VLCSDQQIFWYATEHLCGRRRKREFRILYMCLHIFLILDHTMNVITSMSQVTRHAS